MLTHILYEEIGVITVTWTINFSPQHHIRSFWSHQKCFINIAPLFSLFCTTPFLCKKERFRSYSRLYKRIFWRQSFNVMISGYYFSYIYERCNLHRNDFFVMKANSKLFHKYFLAGVKKTVIKMFCEILWNYFQF